MALGMEIRLRVDLTPSMYNGLSLDAGIEHKHVGDCAGVGDIGR